MKTISILILTAAIAGCRTYDARLYGTWKSDADRSVSRLSTRHDLSQDKQEAWRNIFGQMVITFDKRSFTTELRGITNSIPYRVLGKDSYSVVIQFCEIDAPHENILIIRFDDHGSWISTSPADTWEYFRRQTD